MIWEMLQPLVNWVGGSGLGQWLGQSTDRIAWLFVVHLFGLTLLMGPTVMLGLRLLGLGFRSRPVAELARDTAIFRTTGLVLMLLSGSVIFTGGAVSYFEGQWFRRKMTILVVALVFNFTFFRKVTSAEEEQYSPLVSRLTGLVTLFLWFSVAVAGRAIAFS